MGYEGPKQGSGCLVSIDPIVATIIGRALDLAERWVRVQERSADIAERMIEDRAQEKVEVNTAIAALMRDALKVPK